MDMRISVHDPSVYEINTCTCDDNKVGVVFIVKESDLPYEIIFTREELLEMLKAIKENEIY